MMQAKENQQQFNGIKENIQTTIQHTTKGNALQPSKGIQIVNIHNVQNIQKNQSIKSNGLQVSKQSLNQVNQCKMLNNANQNRPTGLQVKSNDENDIQQKTTKGIQNKLIGQKENGANKRQSLKPAKNEIIDGKIKKIAPKQSSASKLNKKAKKSSTNTLSNNGQKPIVNNQKKESTKPATDVAKKENECDFVIFCDENDELQIKAVEKENAQNEQNQAEIPENKVEKKKGLADRNLKPVQQSNIQVNLQTTVSQKAEKQINEQIKQTSTSVQQLITKTATITQQAKIQTVVEQSDVQTLKSNIELIKEAVVPISNLTLHDETCASEFTFNEHSTIENKENDPTLLSIDLTKEEELEVSEHIDKYRDVSGDMCVKEFSNEIYLYLLNRELKCLPDANYMSKQPEINSKMRAMLVDWLIDVGVEYQLEGETVFLAISYIDQFLSSLTISLQNFQLLGTSALFIASKYEEIYPPELKDFIYVTDDAYTKLQMLSMEKVILKTLKFSVSPPTVLYFLKYFMTKLSLPVYVQLFAEYLCFLSLLNTDPFLSFPRSDIAISSIILSIHTYQIADLIDLDEFKQLTRIHFCKDDEGKLSDAKVILIRQSCVNEMYKLHKNASECSQKAIYTKYSSKEYLSVATVEIEDEVPLVENFF